MAGEADVKLKFTAFANMEEATRAFSKLEQKFDAMQGKLKGSGAATRQPKEVASGWDIAGAAVLKYAGGVALANMALKGTLSVLSAIGDTNQQWQQGLSGMDKRLELMQAKVVMQAGAKGDVGAQDTIRTAAEVAKSMPSMGESLEDYVNAQVFLEGSDLDRKSVKSGGALKGLGRVLAGVSSLEGRGGEFSSTKEAMNIFTTMMTAYGMKGTDEDIASLGTTARGAFKNTKMQGGDLTAFAKNASAFEQYGVGMSEALATFATANEQVGNAESTSVGMRNYLSIMSDVTPERTRQFEELGINQADVSVEKGGTTLDQSLNVWRKALAGKTEEEANTLLTGIVGREASVPMLAMLKRQGRADEVEKMMGDRGEYIGATDEFAGLDISKRRGLLIDTQLQQAEQLWAQGGVSYEQIRDQDSNKFARERVSAGRGAVGQSVISAREAANDLETALAEKLNIDPRDKDVVGARTGDAARAAARTVPLLGEMLGALTQLVFNTTPTRNRNGNVEPAGAN